MSSKASTPLPPSSPEHLEQVKLVARVRHFHPDVLIFAVPNGGLRDPRVAAGLKAEGVLAGVPDLVVAEPRGSYHGLYVEMKRVGIKRVSPKQRRVIRGLNRRGYFVLFANEGVDRAFEHVERYLNLGPHRCPVRRGPVS